MLDLAVRHFSLFLLGLILALSVPSGHAVSQETLGGPKRTVRIEAELVPMSAWAAPGGKPERASRKKAR